MAKSKSPKELALEQKINKVREYMANPETRRTLKEKLRIVNDWIKKGKNRRRTLSV